MAKTKYETIVEPNLVLIERWKRNGASEEEIAKRLGIAYSTFNLYKGQKSELSEVLKKGAEIVDTEVENALLQRALGQTVKLKRPFKVKRTIFENGKKVREEEEIVQADYEEFVPPDTTAQIFWLKNRCPDKWRDKKEIDGVEFKIEVPANIKNLTTEELRKLAGQPAAPSTEEFICASGDNK